MLKNIFLFVTLIAFNVQAEYLRADVPTELAPQLMQGLVSYIPGRSQSAEQMNCRKPELRLGRNAESILIWPTLCSKKTHSALICHQNFSGTNCYVINYGEPDGNADGAGLRDPFGRPKSSITLDHTVSAVLFEIMNAPLEGGVSGSSWGKKSYKNVSCSVTPWSTYSGSIHGAVIYF